MMSTTAAQVTAQRSRRRGARSSVRTLRARGPGRTVESDPARGRRVPRLEAPAPLIKRGSHQVVTMSSIAAKLATWRVNTLIVWMLFTRTVPVEL